jgi:hypothetical protein
VSGEGPDLDGVPLAEIAVVVDDARPRPARGEQALGGVVERAVRDDDQLDVSAGTRATTSRRISSTLPTISSPRL